MTKIWSKDLPGRHSAFDPTQRLLAAPKCPPPLNRREPHPSPDEELLLRTVASAAGTLPVATRPVASPAMVASRDSGKTLLVPVESGTMGMSPQRRPLVAVFHHRQGPQWPSDAGRHHFRCARTVSAGPSSTGMSRNTTFGTLVIRIAHFNRTSNPLGDTTSIAESSEFAHSRHPKRRDEPGNNAALFREREHPALRDQAPDVTARCRVGYDSNNVLVGEKDLR